MLDISQDKSLYAQGKVDYFMVKSNLTRKFLEKETIFVEGNQVTSLLPWDDSGMYSVRLERETLSS